MIINNITGETYSSRKEAKIKLGHTVFNRMVNNREFTFASNIEII